MPSLSVRDVADRQLIRSGSLPATMFGGAWMVAPEDVALLRSHGRPRGRPLGPRRAWALLHLLEGGEAPWLKGPARSQFFHSVAKFASADADQWRAALRGRNEDRRCTAHPAAVDRLVRNDGVLPAGAAVAAKRGFDLVVADEGQTAEVYVQPDAWKGLSTSLAIREAGDRRPNLLVHLPAQVWPFGDASQVFDSALAADLLDSPEPRAVTAALVKLTDSYAALAGRLDRR